MSPAPRGPLKQIGFWCKPDHHDPAQDVANKILDVIVRKLFAIEKLPDPRDHVDWSWDSGEREMVRRYLANGKVSQSYFGWAQCRMCHLISGNGSRDFTDDVYVWPEGYAHYLEEHGVRPPQEFVEHVKRRAGLQQPQQNQRR